MAEKGYYKHTMRDFVVWLSCNIHIIAISAYLTMVNQRLATFFPKNYLSLERSLLGKEEKSLKPLEKWKCQKCQPLTHFFNK